MLKSSKQCFCNSLYSDVILRALLEQVIFGVQYCYRLICLRANFPSVASVVHKKNEHFHEGISTQTLDVLTIIVKPSFEFFDY